MNIEELARRVEMQNEKAEQAAKWDRLRDELWQRVKIAIAKEKCKASDARDRVGAKKK